MSWVIVSAATEDWADITDITWPTQVEYAKRHGYDVAHRVLEPVREDPFPASWAKLPYLMEAMYSGHEGAIWVDADAGFTAAGLREGGLGAVIGDRPVHLGSQFLAGANGVQVRMPSCGLMAVQNTSLGIEWLDELWRRRYQYRDHPWWEQAGAYELMGYHNSPWTYGMDDPHFRDTEWTERVAFFPALWHSTPQDPIDGARLFHATGTEERFYGSNPQEGKRRLLLASL